MSKADEFNAKLDGLMEKISKAVVDEDYAKVVVLNEQLCSAVIEMTDNTNQINNRLYFS